MATDKHEIERIKYYRFAHFEDNYLIDYSQQDEHKHLLPYLKKLHRDYTHCQDLIIAEFEKDVAYPLNNEQKEYRNNLFDISNDVTAILNLLNTEIAVQVALIKNNTNRTEQPKEEEPPLTDKQIEKLGLFIRSGIIDFLREKNPNINNSNISRFLRELTSEYLENAESARPHLTNDTNSPKHPFYKDGSKSKFDLILQKYGISPPLEE